MADLSQLKKSRLIHLCIGISFFGSGIIINAAQFILFVCLKPFNKRMYRKIMYYLCYSLYCQLVFLADWWSNSKLYVYCDEKIFDKREHVLLMMNHSYEIDWLLGWIFCEKLFVLGNCKAYAKKVIGYIPVVGWCWKFAEFVFLERSFDKDKEIIAHQLKEIFDYPDPVWLLLNAEGTRFTEEKHLQSVKFAEERGMTVLKHHLIPRTKGFTASLPTLKGRCDAIYDINLSVKKDDVEATISNLLFGNSVTAYMYVRRIPLEDVPDGETEAAEWLHELFRGKDLLQESFHKNNGDYCKTSGMKEFPCHLQKPRLSTLLNVIGWMSVILIPLFKYMISSLFYGNWITLSVMSLLILAFYILIQKSIGMSEIKKGSKYGAGEPKKNGGESMKKHD